MIIYTDGSSMEGNAGIGFVAFKHGKKIKEFSRAIGKGTNNIAEYKAVIEALRFAIGQGEKRIVIRTDSQLVAKQLNGEYRVKDKKLKPLYEEVKGLMEQLDVKVEWIKRERNKTADRLSKMGNYENKNKE